MSRRIAGAGGINSMRVNLVHKGKKAALNNRFLSDSSYTTSKHRFFSESILPPCGQGMNTLFVFLKKC